MSCNGWNHPPDCDCGWGGDTGGGSGQPTRSHWSLGHSDGFVNPNARCTVCGEAVFYYESPNGGKVWFDELGPPWSKHPCMESRSASINNYGEFLEFTGTRLAPPVAMQMAAELVRYAMKSFRAPTREWPDDDLSTARSELIDWMFRQHETGGDHVVPLSELLQIVGYIEKRAQGAVTRLPTMLSLLEHQKDTEKAAEQKEIFTNSAARGRRTLAIMAQLRAHYQRDEHDDNQQLRVVQE